MSEPTNLVSHLSPNTDVYSRIGIALKVDGANPQEIIGFYNQSGKIPDDVHPLVLYEVAGRGSNGDRLSRALISLDTTGRALEVGSHFFNIIYGSGRSTPLPQDVANARRTLVEIGELVYEASSTTGDGTRVVVPVDVSLQITELLSHHLSTESN